MRRAATSIALLLLPIAVPAQEKLPPKDDYARFSKLLHSMAVKEIPKDGFEDASGWDQRIPYEAGLPLPKLRTVVKVGDKLEMPHGTWRRFKGKIEDPDKNLKIVVKDFKSMDNGKFYRLVLDVDVTILVNIEVQQWQKGLLLVGGQGEADANLTAAITADIDWKFDFKKLPPGLNIEPKISELGLNLVDIKARGGPVLPAGLAKDVKDMLRAAVKASEPDVKKIANEAIAKSLKEGKGSISAGALMDVLPKPKAPPPEKK